ncbi:MAG: bifunctional acetate--CoA ligase family protein/GNAT family N-acetyltransferase [Gammaproteobacteria bacterium]|nr:bifunctional acetate--CoA ligase family protein/GNAT family N-acetyltransferase [Gammaproteobacteria bacterium]MBU1645443.1 bifunctional acetate--CoA ligase family protein/GNAT family N-acetyltransferase [Gammaproteobacteria bacterium]MBU1971066.1 bifunctional acetate--CoA ligase family protein/GNAT family N-acetyltransferase [Gammaproteobacteria bacterium]
MNYEQHYLKPLFEPKSVAIIGASETPCTVGTILVRNMLDGGYKGKLFCVNPGHETVFGHKSYDSVESIPQRLDLAVICTRPETVPGIVEACGRAGTRNVIVVTGGFAESGPRGASLERAVIETARRHRIRLIGPNCLGIMRPSSGVNLTFAHGGATPGSIGLVSQSGALCTAILDWAQPNNVGFSTVVSLGATSDVDFGEILDYLVADPKTENIFLYIEGIKNPRRFMSALRAAARCKPVLLIKVGKHAAGGKAALSHTGSLVGADDVFDAALRRAGVVRLGNVGQMYAAASALFSHFRPRGNRLAIITNGGGPGAMAADHASDIGIPLAKLSDATVARLNELLPQAWSKANPLDIGGDADPGRYAAALTACIEDDGVDGLLVILTPQAMTDPTQAARTLLKIATKSDKPVVTCWMGGSQVHEARLLFKGSGIPSFRTPEPAVELFSHISAYYRNQQLLMQTPAAIADHVPPRLESARLVIETALGEGRRILNEMESKALLAAFRIPIAQTVVARSPSEAMVLAEEIGLPVVMKIDSPQIIHKTDSGGVRLNLNSLAAVRDAYNQILDEVKKNRPDAVARGVAIEPMIQKANGRELMMGMVKDEIFGPTIVFGRGGTDVETGRSARAVALPPLNRFLVGDLLESARDMARLGEFRNMPAVNLAALEGVLLRVSEMVCELPWITELDINPLIVDELGAVAVDARIAIENIPLTAGRYDHMAIHPYPSHLVTTFQSKDGKTVTIRPIKPEDADIENEFVRKLSPETKYFRFMNTIRELGQSQLIRLTQIDYDREMAFIAITENDGAELEIGVCRYATNPDGESCEFAIVVADDWQGKGLARRLMGVLIETASGRGLKYMNGDFLAENGRMLAFVQTLGFVLSPHPDDPGLKRGVLVLN